MARWSSTGPAETTSGFFANSAPGRRQRHNCRSVLVSRWASWGRMTAVLRLSQVIFGVGNLDAATDRFRSLGFDVLDGGVHPGVGTANRVIPLGAQYIELLGVVSPDQARQNDYGRSLLRSTA